MKIAVTASNNNGFESEVNKHFGRSPFFAIVDTEVEEIELVKNSAAQASSGAGVQAAQLISDQGVEVLLSGSVGPKAYTALSSGNIKMYISQDETVHEAVKSLENNNLSQLTSPNGTPRK
ncbi:MAG: NifB/NifX family molybdenum-iron cluster-binding protein [Halanaerobiales bacterium]|nr:NifB/NifX family molybdenum-iron cluster-binding protein [Halanaerobiales bacterium]